MQYKTAVIRIIVINIIIIIIFIIIMHLFYLPPLSNDIALDPYTVTERRGG